MTARFIPALLACLALLAPAGHALALSPDASSLIAAGDELDRQLRTAEALEAYLQAEKLAPRDPSLLIKIAKQYGESMVDLESAAERRAAGEKALAYALRAAEIAPAMADAHLAVAICHGRLVDLLPARQKVEASREIKSRTELALQLDPRSDYAWHMLGRWHRSVANVSPLLKGMVRVIYGGLPAASSEAAVEAFEKAIALRPDRLAHHIELGITRAEMGEKEAARLALKRGLALPERERDDPGTKQRGRATLATIGD